MLAVSGHVTGAISTLHHIITIHTITPMSRVDNQTLLQGHIVIYICFIHNAIVGRTHLAFSFIVQLPSEIMEKFNDRSLFSRDFMYLSI
jgi:hypothetical protein